MTTSPLVAATLRATGILMVGVVTVESAELLFSLEPQLPELGSFWIKRPIPWDRTIRMRYSADIDRHGLRTRHAREQAHSS